MPVKSGAAVDDILTRGGNVLLAIFADIHANRQTLCLEAARARGAERMIFLGDYIGYGADPEWTLETVMGLVERGAAAVLGNHDEAVNAPTITFNAAAQAAVEWTRGRLGAEQHRFLSELPLTLQEEDRLYVHSEASSPASWRYVQSASDATRSIMATPLHVTFCGHIAAMATGFVSASGIPVPLPPNGAGSPFSARSGSPATAIRRPRL
jgi:diadenosine tetraphosphatase ApaH/serine/threonine PP2A family protein phosphatase